MKLMKYTFRTPIFGSIECEELISDADGRIELAPQEMCKMYDKGPELLQFLTENAEDLTYCIPEELQDTVLRAEFGDFAILGGKMWLRTYIWTEYSLTEQGIAEIEEWIIGQMSDGWGEGLEQKSWMTKRIEKPSVYFDGYTLEFEETTELYEVSYYVNPWNSEEFYIYLDDCEEVEEDAHTEVVASINLPFRSLEVVKVSSGVALRRLLREYRESELATLIEDSALPSPSGYSVYLVKDLDGNSGEEILPKWVIERGSFCCLYKMEDDEEVRGTQVPLRRAVLELMQ